MPTDFEKVLRRPSAKPIHMPHSARVTPLSAVGHVGGTNFLIQAKGSRDGLMVDFGANMQAESELFGGRSAWRESHGIDDLLGLDLLPRFRNLYRTDAVLEEDLLEGAREIRVTDAFATHAHFDHTGRLFALDPSIRVHCTAVTAAFLHADAMCGKGIASEITHVVEREPHPTEIGILRKPRNGEALPRSFNLVDRSPSQALVDRWSALGPSESLARSNLRAAGMRMRAHRVDHSIWGAAAVSLVMPDGTLVSHSGDARQSGADAERSHDYVRWLVRNRPDAWILEGTRIGRENDVQVTEAQCAEAILRAMRTARGRLVVACVGHRHLERLRSTIAAAMACGRRVVVSPRLMYLLESVADADGTYDVSKEGVAMYDPPLPRRDAWHRDLRERCDERLVHPDEVRKDPSRFVVLWGFGKSVDLRDVQPYGATLIWASSRAYGGDAKGRHSELGNWSALFGMDTHGIEFSRRGVEYDPTFAPSGHWHPTELRKALHRVQPRLLIGCHSENLEAFRELAPEGTKVVVPQEGRTIHV